MKQPAVYIVTCKTKSALYIGVTGSLKKRIWQHKNAVEKGFSRKYKTNKLVYFELFDDFYTAISREKQLKKWNRSWKERLINEANPNWDDLYEQI
ncbi:GIY-YIG nuclease family protein [Vibrio rotiferianus]|uniref:GIY-YIG nuclease family protein n=1 Tax=Vibrio rotiferianus TaxID=190895 RepID=UPI0015F38934|nr:GIY-YIG nuclease family protein [Vibrio rotiferianus]